MYLITKAQVNGVLLTHIDTGQLIFSANKWTGFSIIVTLVVTELKEEF